MSEEGQPLYISRPAQGVIEDPGLDNHSLAAMTGEEAKDYLELLVKVLQLRLPSLPWLRQTTLSNPRVRDGIAREWDVRCTENPNYEPEGHDE